MLKQVVSDYLLQNQNSFFKIKDKKKPAIKISQANSL